MKQRKTNMVRLTVAALAALAVTAGVVLAAGEGTQADPLVTLSYLTQTVTPSVMTQVDGKAEAYQQELVDKLDQSIQTYTGKMEQIVQEQSGKMNAATYTVVTLRKDQKLNMDIGCEVMLRIGTAQCVSPSNPGLINTTAGTALNNGEELAVNNLYMATITGRSIKATANTVKVLVRGGYTVA